MLKKIVDGGIFSTQTELNTLRGCTKINGDLIIESFDDATINFSIFDCLHLFSFKTPIIDAKK